jgi:DNA-cytosine methyltransferase
MKIRNTLSLFDGMSCLQIALNKANIQYDKYYASEIDKYAIQVTQSNYPNTMQLGDVTKWKQWDIDWSTIDLVAGGSPCQGFSFAGKQLAFDDPRSKLFFVFVEIVNHVKKHNPDVKFLLENVKMKKEHEIIISQYMGVAPIEINSALLSAQNRVRLYWTNIANEPYGLFGDMMCTIPQPKDKGILLRDILQDDVPDKYYLSDKMLKYFEERAANFNQGKVNIREEDGKASCLTSSMASCDISDNFIKIDKGGNHSDMDLLCFGADYRSDEGIRIRDGGKSNTLQAKQICVGNDNFVGINASGKEGGDKAGTLLSRYHKGASTFGSDTFIKEVFAADCHSAIQIPEATKKGYTEVSPGECFDLTMPESKTRRGRLMEDKSNCLTAAKYDFMQYTENLKIRRLTPLECERLQTVPDNYTAAVSDTQRYKMLGNGWTVDVIVHILSFLTKNVK